MDCNSVLCRVNVQQTVFLNNVAFSNLKRVKGVKRVKRVTFVFLKIAFNHLPKAEFGVLNMEVLFAVANIAAEILWTAIPYFVEFMFKELLSHVCFLECCI